tara:strand:- start:5350 stop:5730 length:381 start_codon:yes stop_codon:yes gene_type:complete
MPSQTIVKIKTLLDDLEKQIKAKETKPVGPVVPDTPVGPVVPDTPVGTDTPVKCRTLSVAECNNNTHCRTHRFKKQGRKRSKPTCVNKEKITGGKRHRRTKRRRKKRTKKKNKKRRRTKKKRRRRR